MQAAYAPEFDREAGCTEAEWLGWLPAALGEVDWRLVDGGADVVIGQGRLALRWHTLPPRQIALMRMPRLAVSFSFSGVDDATRYTFMRRFDLYMQRGGG
jgi:hypothetical protein